MLLINFFSIFAVSALAAADAMLDFSNLHSDLQNTSTQILDSVIVLPSIPSSNLTNTTLMAPLAFSYPFATAAALQNTTYSIASCMAYAMQHQDSYGNNQTQEALDNAYQLYVNEILSLAQAVVARGRAWHSEQNQPVYITLQYLAVAIDNYGRALSQLQLIGIGSIIRTRTAESAILNAETAWTQDGTTPG